MTPIEFAITLVDITIIIPLGLLIVGTMIDEDDKARKTAYPPKGYLKPGSFVTYRGRIRRVTSVDEINGWFYDETFRSVFMECRRVTRINGCLVRWVGTAYFEMYP